MATIVNWNGHTLEVSSKLIRSFSDLSIKGGCETTDKNSDKQKYVERKYGEIPVIEISVQLNAFTGVTDVYAEAMEYIEEATAGACDYFYMGSSKLFPAKLMLTNAEITEVVLMPGRGDKWISCDVKLTFKQGTKNDGSASGSGSGAGGAKAKAVVNAGVTVAKAALNVVADVVAAAKKQSESKNAGLDYRTDQVNKKTTTQPTSNVKLNPTTTRTYGIVDSKLTLAKPVNTSSKLL